VGLGFVEPATKRQVVYATPRVWSYLGIITIPQGKITASLSQSSCPSVQLSGTGAAQDPSLQNAYGGVANGATVILTNPSGQTSNVQIVQGQNFTDTTSPLAMTDPLCYYDGNPNTPVTTTVAVPPYATVSTTISNCYNMTITINIENFIPGIGLAYQECSKLSSNFVDAGVKIPESLPNNVQTTINVAVSQVQAAQQQLTTQLFENMLTMLSTSLPGTNPTASLY
jgi:hypothetical protein